MGTWGRGRGSGTARAFAKAVKRRDGYQCQLCGYQGTPGTGDVEADHITPLARGGTHTIDNGITLCRGCHRPKSESERIAGLHRRTQRPQEPHPGLIPTNTPGG